MKAKLSSMIVAGAIAIGREAQGRHSGGFALLLIAGAALILNGVFPWMMIDGR